MLDESYPFPMFEAGDIKTFAGHPLPYSHYAAGGCFGHCLGLGMDVMCINLKLPIPPYNLSDEGEIKGILKKPKLPVGMAEEKTTEPMKQTRTQQRRQLTRGLESEIKILNSLRHPNIALFIGLFMGPEDTISALYETFPRNLNDILEGISTTSTESGSSALKLTTPEILDIFLEVSKGLQYLHSLQPSPLIHGNLTAKHILLVSGNKAKVLVVGASLAASDRNTPYCLPYASPEILQTPELMTTKCDIYSLGVLMVYACSGLLPNDNKADREDQLKIAASVHVCLAGLMLACLNVDPLHRPDITECSTYLRNQISNDRHYPLERKLYPRSEIGVDMRKLIQETTESHSRESLIQIDSLQQRVIALESRWRTEAEKVNETSLQLSQTEEQLLHMTGRYEDSQDECSRLKAKLDAAYKDIQRLENLLLATTEENMQLKEVMRNQEEKIRLQSVDLDNYQNKTVIALDRRIDFMEKAVATAKAKEEEARETIKSMQKASEEQAEFMEELEARLAQALSGWKNEQDAHKEEKQMHIKAKMAFSVAQNNLDKAKIEIERLSKDLHQYDHLPLPEEITYRFQAMESDIDRLMEENENLSTSRDALQAQMMELSVTAESSTQKIQSLEDEITALKADIDAKSRQIATLKRDYKYLETDFDSEKTKTRELEAERDRLYEVEKKLEEELASTKKALALEMRRVELIQARINSGHKGEDAVVKDEDLVEDDEEEGKGDEDKDSDEEGAPEGGEEGGGDGGNAEGAGMENLDKGSLTTTSLDSQGKPRKPRQENIFDKLKKIASNANYAKQNIKVMDKLDDEMEQAIIANRERLAEENARDILKAALSTSSAAADSTAAGGGSGGGGGGEGEPGTATTINVNGLVSQSFPTLSPLMALFSKHRKNDRVLWRACRAVRDILVKSPEAQDECIAQKVDEKVFKTLKSNLSSKMVQSQGCRLIGSLSFGRDAVRRRLGEKGIMQHIVKAMEAHVDDEGVLTHACTAITNLAHNSVENRSRFLDHQGVEVLVAIMDRHKNSSKLQRQACWALLTIAGTDEASRAVVKGGAISAVINAMLIHRYDAGVQQFACWAMSNMALAGDDIKRRIRKAGFAEVCRIAMETHVHDSEVIRQARHALGVVNVSQNQSL